MSETQGSFDENSSPLPPLSILNLIRQRPLYTYSYYRYDVDPDFAIYHGNQLEMETEEEEDTWSSPPPVQRYLMPKNEVTGM